MLAKMDGDQNPRSELTKLITNSLLRYDQSERVDHTDPYKEGKENPPNFPALTS